MTSCRRCKYLDTVIVDDAEPLSICRRFPPVEGAWSEVFADDWCGEFRPRGDTHAPGE